MANWQWSIGPWRPGTSRLPALFGQSGPQAALTSATARSLKLKLLDPSEASFTIGGFSAEALIVEELITDLWVWRDGTALFRGRVQATTDTITPAGYGLAVTARDYRYVLERRIAYADRTWTSIEQSTIVWDAIVDTQTLPGGDLGVTQGTWPVTGVVRPSVIVTAGDTVWSLIKKLGAMSGGFDFDIDVNLAAHLYYPRRGVETGDTLDYGGVVAEVLRGFDPDKYANAIRQSGADGITPATTATADISAAPEGRWDAQYGDTQLTTADMVTQTAAANLALASLLMPTYSLKLAAGRWGGPSHVWLGDYVPVVVKAGRLNERVLARVYELAIDVDVAGVETVTVVAGDIRMDRRSVLRGIAKRVQQLMRR